MLRSRCQFVTVLLTAFSCAIGSIGGVLHQACEHHGPASGAHFHGHSHAHHEGETADLPAGNRVGGEHHHLQLDDDFCALCAASSLPLFSESVESQIAWRNAVEVQRLGNGRFAVAQTRLRECQPRSPPASLRG